MLHIKNRIASAIFAASILLPFGQAAAHAAPAAATTDRPDLVIMQAQFVDCSSRIKVTVVNFGKAPAGHFRVGFQNAGGNIPVVYNLPAGLPQGGSATFVVSLPKHELVRAIADRDGVVAESNETNNAKIATGVCS